MGRKCAFRRWQRFWSLDDTFWGSQPGVCTCHPARFISKTGWYEEGDTVQSTCLHSNHPRKWERNKRLNYLHAIRRREIECVFFCASSPWSWLGPAPPFRRKKNFLSSGSLALHGRLIWLPATLALGGWGGVEWYLLLTHEFIHSELSRKPIHPKLEAIWFLNYFAHSTWYGAAH